MTALLPVFVARKPAAHSEVMPGMSAGPLSMAGMLARLNAPAGDLGRPGRALEAIPPEAAAGFTTFCVKPSQFTDDPRDVGRLCQDIIRRVDNLYS